MRALLLLKMQVMACPIRPAVMEPVAEPKFFGNRLQWACAVL
jgi:hypothetical protein